MRQTGRCLPVTRSLIASKRPSSAITRPTETLVVIAGIAHRRTTAPRAKPSAHPWPTKRLAGRVGALLPHPCHRARCGGARVPCQAGCGISCGIKWCLLPGLDEAGVGERRTPDAWSGLESTGSRALIIPGSRVRVPPAPPKVQVSMPLGDDSAEVCGPVVKSKLSR